MKRFGLFGGTFNPIHIGHLRVAIEIREAFNLDGIYLIPSAIPPHKTAADIVDADDRLEMTRQAAVQCKSLTVSDIEVQRSGPSYTIDTVAEFRHRHPNDSLFLIMGFDAFLEVDSWKSVSELLRDIPFIVAARPDSPPQTDIRQKMDAYLKSRISDRYRYHPEDSFYSHPENQSIYTFNASLLDISSTRIRQLIKSGKSIRFLTPDTVVNYITNKGLYL